MARDNLPTEENFTIVAGSTYFRKKGSSRIVSLGYLDSLSWTPNIETLDAYAKVNGVRTKVKDFVQSVDVEISATLKELRADNLALAYQGSLETYTQSAATDVEVMMADVVSGELVQLDYLDVSSVEITAGAEGSEVSLEAGMDFQLNSGPGSVLFYGEFENVKITFSAPAIEDSANRAAISILNSPRGLEGEFIFEGENPEGKRFRLDKMRAQLRPSGSVPIDSTGEELAQIELTGTGIRNTASPAYPWGRLVELS